MMLQIGALRCLKARLSRQSMFYADYLSSDSHLKPTSQKDVKSLVRIALNHMRNAETDQKSLQAISIILQSNMILADKNYSEDNKMLNEAIILLGKLFANVEQVTLWTISNYFSILAIQVKKDSRQATASIQFILNNLPKITILPPPESYS